MAPTNEDLAIAVIGNDSSRDIFWVLNNFIFYLGYLTLVCLPFVFFSFFSLIKKESKVYLVILILSLSLSFYFERFFLYLQN